MSRLRERQFGEAAVPPRRWVLSRQRPSCVSLTWIATPLGVALAVKGRGKLLISRGKGRYREEAFPPWSRHSRPVDFRSHPTALAFRRLSLRFQVLDRLFSWC